MANYEVSFGNPEFCPQVFEAFPKFFEVIRQAENSLNSILTRGYEELDPLQKVILNLGILAGNSFMEVVTLVGHGFGLGGMKITRTLLETCINAEYLRITPAECDDYLDWHFVEQHKWLVYIKENIPDRLKEISNEASAEAEFANVRSRFERPNGDLRSGWCRLDLASRATKTGFQDSYRVVYPIGSQLIHGTFGALAMHSRDSRDDIRIGTPPSLYYCEQALSSAHICLLRVIDTLSKGLGAEPTPPISELINSYLYAWRKSEASASPT